MTEIEIPLNDYYSSYEAMAKEIQEGMDEGFSEGLREGIKQGFVAGIRECRATGFDKIDVKSLEDILKGAFETASDEAIRVTVKRTVSSEYREKISPSFKKKMEEACNKAVKEIKSSNLELEESSASELKNRVDLSVKKAKKYIGSACGGVKKKLPKDMIFKVFFGSLQDEFNRDLDENLEVCRMRIYKEIDSKIDNKKVGHGRH